MALKLVPFESLDAASYSPSVTVAVHVAICEIFNVHTSTPRLQIRP